MIKIGPLGGSGNGSYWDEKGRNRLTQIFISHDDYIVKSIQSQYEQNGYALLSDVRGSISGTNFSVVKLRFPEEYLTGMRVRYDSSSVKSLTFITNLTTYGPFGLKKDQSLSEFLIELGEDRQFGGFHGTAYSDRLCSIGVYLQPCFLRGRP